LGCISEWGYVKDEQQGHAGGVALAAMDVMRLLSQRTDTLVYSQS
jgi:hypothetical protein